MSFNLSLLSVQSFQQGLAEAQVALLSDLTAPPGAAICITAERCHEIAALAGDHSHQR